MRRCKPRFAFTLVELLVVVAIIALLIAILLPSLKKARGAAVGAVCSSNQRNLLVGHAMYVTDNRGWYAPVMSKKLKVAIGSTNHPWLPWYSKYYVGQYVGNTHSCSSADGSQNQRPSTDVICCPNKKKAGYYLDTGIGYNNSRQNFFNRYDMDWPDWKGRTLKNYFEFKHPDTTFLLVDVQTSYTGSTMAWERYYDGDSGSHTASDDGGNNRIHTGYPAYRHNQATPVGFADGHVTQYTSTDPADPNQGVSKARYRGELTHKAAY